MTYGAAKTRGLTNQPDQEQANSPANKDGKKLVKHHMPQEKKNCLGNGEDKCYTCDLAIRRHRVSPLENHRKI